MINNFDEIKRQLKELSGVVNAFKSEAVQLRLIELVFAGAGAKSTPAGVESESTPRTRNRKRAGRRSAPKKSTADVPKGNRPARSGARIGAKATLSRLHEEGFFKKPRTLNDIVKHAETNLATKLKQSDLSGPLARYVRDVKLKRSKNKDNQYEYIEA